MPLTRGTLLPAAAARSACGAAARAGARRPPQPLGRPRRPERAPRRRRVRPLELVADPVRAVRQADERASGAVGRRRHGMRADGGVAGGSECLRPALAPRSGAASASQVGEPPRPARTRGAVAASRASSTRQPWPAAGTTAAGSSGAPSSPRPSRSSPACASTIASKSPSAEAPQPRVHVAAQLTHVEVGSQSQERGAAAQARRAHHRALGKVVERRPRRRAHRARRPAPARPRSRARPAARPARPSPNARRGRSRPASSASSISLTKRDLSASATLDLPKGV